MVHVPETPFLVNALYTEATCDYIRQLIFELAYYI
jgi:hypothetical protein